MIPVHYKTKTESLYIIPYAVYSLRVVSPRRRSAIPSVYVAAIALYEIDGDGSVLLILLMLVDIQQ